MIEIRRLAASRAVSFDRRPTIESGVDALLVVIDGESIQLAMKVETIPEKGLVEILAPKSADEALYERVRARREGDGLKFLQEEILWLCEAAHCPAIWATQVLETLAKQGTPSRAEITDAAMGHRAECVMLNKGPHINEALRVLDDILKRMDAHQSKKRAMLRALKVADDFDGVREAADGWSG